MFKLNDVWGMIVQPAKTIERVIKTKTLKSAVFVLILFVTFHFVSKFVISKSFYASTLNEERLITLSLINFLIVLFYWFIGYSLIHIVSISLKGKGSYIHLLIAGAYISVIGLPFKISYTLGMHTTTTEGVVINCVFETIFGLFSPCLQLINQIGIFLNKWGSITSSLGLKVYFLVYMWILAVVILAIKKVYQFSLKRALISFIVSFIIFSILVNILESVVIEPLVRNIL